jgi:hypothetical protein
MGTKNSKENLDLISSNITTNNNRWRSSIQNKTIIYSGWQEICRCSHIDWLHGISRMKIFQAKYFYHFP